MFIDSDADADEQMSAIWVSFPLTRKVAVLCSSFKEEQHRYHHNDHNYHINYYYNNCYYHNYNYNNCYHNYYYNNCYRKYNRSDENAQENVIGDLGVSGYRKCFNLSTSCIRKLP